MVGAPKLNTELGKIVKSTKTNKLYLKTVSWVGLGVTGTAHKSCESSQGTTTTTTTNPIPGLDLTSKEKKVRDSILHVPEVLPEKPEEAWKRYQDRGFLKKMKIMKEEEEEKVWNEFLAMVTENEDCPNWEIVKRTQKAHSDGQKEKTIKSMKEGIEEEEDDDEEEGEQHEGDEEEKGPIKKMKTPDKFPREEEEKVWNELVDFLKNFPKLEEIVKRRPKRTPRQKVSY